MTSCRPLGALLLLGSAVALIAYYLPAKRFVVAMGLPPVAVLAVIAASIVIAFALLRRGRGR